MYIFKYRLLISPFKNGLDKFLSLKGKTEPVARTSEERLRVCVVERDRES